MEPHPQMACMVQQVQHAGILLAVLRPLGSLGQDTLQHQLEGPCNRQAAHAVRSGLKSGLGQRACQRREEGHTWGQAAPQRQGQCSLELETSTRPEQAPMWQTMGRGCLSESRPQQRLDIPAPAADMP